MALRDFFGGVEAREEDAEGNEASAEFPEACSDRSPETADAGEKRRHGQPNTLVFVYKIVTERQRTELPRASAKRERSPGSEQRNREIFLMFKEKRRQQKKAEKRRDG